MWLREVFKPMKIFTTVILLTALVTPLKAQWLERRTPGIPRTADGKPNLTAAAPRTADGKPDLAGLWEMIGAVRRPGDLQPADVQPWAQALVQQRAEHFGIDNPKAYNKAWTLRLSARLAADTEMMESVCNERPDNGQEHWIGKASDAQKTAVKVAPELLAKYVGVYKGIYLRNARTVEVTFSDGALSVSVNGGPKQRIVLKSASNISGYGLI